MLKDTRALLWLLLGWLMSVPLLQAQPTPKPENLGKKVNSEHQELLPVISPDGLRLYFARKNHPQNYLAPQESQEIWYSDYDARTDTWGEAIHMSKEFNSEQINGIGAISPDGNTILLRGEAQAGDQSSSGFSIRTQTLDGWSESTPLLIEGLPAMSKGVFMGGTLAGDGRTLLLYFSEQMRSETNDIYVSFLQDDGSWSKPEGLGKTINTEASEVAPFLAADGRTLYFASDREGGQGGYDIYRSQRQGGSWTKWSEPENLGPPVNTPSFEAYYTISASGEYAYMVSEENSIGQSDIIRIPLTEAQKPDPVVLVTGTVMDRLAGTPLETKLQYRIQTTGEVVGQGSSSAKDGSYKLTLPYGYQYEIVASNPDYETSIEPLDLRVKRDYQVMEVNLSLLTTGDALRASAPEMLADPFGTLLSSVYFKGKSLEIEAASEFELNLVLGALRANPELAMVIQGNADIPGSHETNMTLSKHRAQQIRAWLIAKGIAPHRLPTIGYGNTKPATLDRSPEGLKLNNRVEFHYDR